MLNLFQTLQDFHISINGLLRGEPQRPQNIIGGSKVVAKKEMLKKKIAHTVCGALHEKRVVQCEHCSLQTVLICFQLKENGLQMTSQSSLVKGIRPSLIMWPQELYICRRAQIEASLNRVAVSKKKSELLWHWNLLCC